jgi:hypothetical protein
MPLGNLRKIRIILGSALVGSVMTGVFFGWMDLSFNPRIIGASLAALVSVVKVYRLA